MPFPIRNTFDSPVTPVDPFPIHILELSLLVYERPDCKPTNTLLDPDVILCPAVNPTPTLWDPVVKLFKAFNPNAVL